MSGKLIVIDGVDSSGKETHTLRLFDRLQQEKYNIRKIQFPNYESDSSALIKMYLNGDFGSNPGDVNPYIASSFYAADRFASYRGDWQEFYKSGGIVLADRYTTSNMVHQAAKIKDAEEKEKFLDWLWDYEFVKFELPVPDCVIFLDMPPEFGQKLMQERNNKFTGEAEKDIHEKNYEYILNSYNNACGVAKKYKWERVSCIADGQIKTIDAIHDEVYERVKAIL